MVMMVEMKKEFIKEFAKRSLSSIWILDMKIRERGVAKMILKLVAKRSQQILID